jgi:hypothetical protein
MAGIRRISLPTHGFLELAAGLGLLAGAFVLDLGTGGTIAAFAAGVLLTGLGFGAADDLPLAAHLAMDRWITSLLAAGSIGVALGGDVAGSILLLAAAAGQLALTAGTRWVRPPLVH